MTLGLVYGVAPFPAEASEWLDRVIRVPTLGSLTLDQWIEEFEKLRKLNREVMGTPKSARRRKSTSQQT